MKWPALLFFSIFLVACGGGNNSQTSSSDSSQSSSAESSQSSSTDGGQSSSSTSSESSSSESGQSSSSESSNSESSSSQSSSSDTSSSQSSSSDSSSSVSSILDSECDPSSPVGLTPAMENAVALAESRYSDVLARTANSSKKFISYTDTDGKWALEKSSNWTSGFLPGSLWYLYGLTGTASWQTDAETYSALVRSRATATDNDTGFQIYCPFGTGRTMLGGTWAEADAAISDGAQTLVTERYNPNIGAFRAWAGNEDDPYNISSDGDFEVNVDMMMNMEIILSAAEKSGNTDYMDAAISHADVTWENIIRSDYSSYHVAAFYANGDLSYNRTHQGWQKDSTWTRGQSWAVYSYAMLYRYTGLPRMLERSELTYQYFKNAVFEQTDTWIPYADFDAPIGIRNPSDTSASAVVASAALELYEITGNTIYLDDANEIINQLVEGYLSTDTGFESILLGASEKYFNVDTPDANGYEVGASFADYYFLEALYRLKNATPPMCN